MRAWGGVGIRVPVPEPIPVQICGQLPVPRPIPNNAGIYPPIVGIFCGCPLGLSPIIIPTFNTRFTPALHHAELGSDISKLGGSSTLDQEKLHEWEGMTYFFFFFKIMDNIKYVLT